MPQSSSTKAIKLMIKYLLYFKDLKECIYKIRNKNAFISLIECVNLITMKKQYGFILAIAITMVITFSAIVACSKENNVDHFTPEVSVGDAHNDYIVAVLPDKKDGTNDLELTFDKMQFMHILDSIINLKNEDEYVTEDVVAYIQYEDDGSSTPYLAVSEINLTDASSEVLFIVLETIQSKDNKPKPGQIYRLTDNKNITCHTNDVAECRRAAQYPGGVDPSACLPFERISDGMLQCKPCHNIACTQTTTGNAVTVENVQSALDRI